MLVIPAKAGIQLFLSVFEVQGFHSPAASG
jgi:hypothetical protein